MELWILDLYNFNIIENIENALIYIFSHLWRVFWYDKLNNSTHFQARLCKIFFCWEIYMAASSCSTLPLKATSLSGLNSGKKWSTFPFHKKSYFKDPNDSYHTSTAQSAVSCWPQKSATIKPTWAYWVLQKSEKSYGFYWSKKITPFPSLISF